MGNSYVVGRGDTIPVDFFFYRGGVPITNATVTVQVLEYGSTGYLIDWNNSPPSFAASPVTDTLTLTHAGNGNYTLAGGLALSTASLDATTTMLHANFSATSSSGNATDTDVFSLSGLPITIPASGSDIDVFATALYPALVNSALAEIIQYTPTGESMFQTRGVFDLAAERLTLAQGVQVVSPMPMLKLAASEVPSGISLARGDTFVARSVTYSVAYPPEYNGRGGIMLWCKG